MTSKVQSVRAWLRYCILLLLCGYCQISTAAPPTPAPSTCLNKYRITAVDEANHINVTLFGENTPMPGEDLCEFNSVFNDASCRTKYLCTDYVGSTLTLHSEYQETESNYVSTSNYYYAALTPTSSFQYRVYKNSTLLPYSEIIGAPGGGLSASAQYFPDGVNLYGDPAPGIQLHFTEAGIYRVEIDDRRPVVGVVGYLPQDLVYYIIVLPKIESVNISAPGICYAWQPVSDNKYHFNIQTTPSITTIMSDPHIAALISDPSLNKMVIPDVYNETFPHTSCIEKGIIDIKLGIQINSAAGNSLAVDMSFPQNTYSNLNWPSAYPSPYDFTTVYDNGTDYDDLQSYLFSSGSFGSNYGDPLSINVILYDYVSYHPSPVGSGEPATPLTASAPLTIGAVPKINVDINSVCAPGYSTPAVVPQYTATLSDGGIPPFNYYWSPAGSNNMTLDNNYVSNPKVTGIINPANPLTGNFQLTVNDAGGCQYSKLLNTNFITSGYDLASKDTYSDLFQEPYASGSVFPDDNIWASPDIWNRHNPDGVPVHEAPEYTPDNPTNPTFGKPNYLYTKVRNIGCQVSPANVAGHGAPYLGSYWTIGGFGGAEAWPAAWTTGVLPGTGVIIANQGMWIANTNIPPINPGQYSIIQSLWTPPNPQNYTAAYTTTPTTMDLCFLTRIVDYHNLSADPTFGMTVQEQTGVVPNDNIRNNNNISTRNTTVMYVNGSPRVSYIYIGNLGHVRANYSIELSNVLQQLPNRRVSHLSEYMDFEIFLGDLFDRWTSGGSFGKYTQGQIDYAAKSIRFDGSQTIKLDSVVIDSGLVYPIKIVARLKPGVDGSTMPEETISFRQMLADNSGTLMGNYTYTVKYRKDAAPKGVLAVTEASNGPSGDCEYAEMIAANCGSDSASAVDIRGWIIDDNSGNFNTSGCTTGVGTAQGHYRLAFDDVWSNVPVGSVLVVYNHDANCYNLSDTFRIDTTASGLTYWIPIGGTVTAPYGTPHIDRYGARPNTSLCAYCSDSGITSYTIASAWTSTVGLNNTNDAFQVRCPGCNTYYSGAPSFYHGIGYGPLSGVNAFASIPHSTYDLGGPVINGSGTGYKYVFVGAGKADLGNAAMWTRVTADAAGSVPSTLGVVPALLKDSIINHRLNLPCCKIFGAKSANGNVEGTTINSSVDGILVYPNPAHTMVNFEFPATEKVSVKILDISGRLMSEQTLQDANHAAFSVDKFAPGMYIYQIITNSSIQSGKFIVD